MAKLAILLQDVEDRVVKMDADQAVKIIVILHAVVLAKVMLMQYLE